MRSEIKDLPVDIIAITGHNNREVIDEKTLFELSESMVENTMLNPILVNQAGGKYKLIAGERRLRAAKAAGQKTIECKVFKGITEVQAVKMMLAENRDRVSLNVIERAKGIAKLTDLGVSIQDVAAAEHLTPQTVSNYLDLLKLPESVQDMLVREHNPLPMYQALMLLKAPVDRREELAVKAAPLYGQGVSRDELDELIANIKTPRLPIDQSVHTYKSTPQVYDSEGNSTTKKGIDKSRCKEVSCQFVINGRLVIDEGLSVSVSDATVTYRVGGEIETFATEKFDINLNAPQAGKIKKLYEKGKK